MREQPRTAKSTSRHSPTAGAGPAGGHPARGRSPPRRADRSRRRRCLGEPASGASRGGARRERFGLSAAGRPACPVVSTSRSTRCSSTRSSCTSWARVVVVGGDGDPLLTVPGVSVHRWVDTLDAGALSEPAGTAAHGGRLHDLRRPDECRPDQDLARGRCGDRRRVQSPAADPQAHRQRGRAHQGGGDRLGFSPTRSD